MDAEPDQVGSGYEPGSVTCLACHCAFDVKWPWEILADGCKYFRLDQYFSCPACGAKHMYSLEQSHNYHQIVGIGKNVRRSNKRMANWKPDDPFYSGSTN